MTPLEALSIIQTRRRLIYLTTARLNHVYRIYQSFVCHQMDFILKSNNCRNENETFCSIELWSQPFRIAWDYEYNNSNYYPNLTLCVSR